MVNKEAILKTKAILDEFLKVEKIQEDAENKFKEEFALGEDKEYRNPFRVNYDFEKTLRDVRDGVISFIIRTFNDEYPNIELKTENFKEFIITKYSEKYKRDEDTNELNFDKIIKYLEDLESHRGTLAIQYLVKNALKLVPHQFLRGATWDEKRKFKADEIVKKNKLFLYAGWNYGRLNTEYTKDLLKIINVLLNNAKPEKAKEDIISGQAYFKYFKNGRLDVELKTPEDAMKIAKFLEEYQ